MFDVGLNGRDLLHNMARLNINPGEIEWLVLSHGHYDHTYGLKEFLKVLSGDKKIKVILHPGALEPKKAKIKLLNLLTIKVSIGFPKLAKTLARRMELITTKEPYFITPWLCTTGEISKRSEKDGTAERMVHKVDGKWVKDPLLDDQSLVIHTDNGLVVVCGCCHAGVLNTLSHVKNLFPERTIHAVVGGTHMLNFFDEALKHVGDVLEDKYNTPYLYLNHCTGQHVIDYFKERFGADKVKLCFVGTEIKFKLSSS